MVAGLGLMAWAWLTVGRQVMAGLRPPAAADGGVLERTAAPDPTAVQPRRMELRGAGRTRCRGLQPVRRRPRRTVRPHRRSGRPDVDADACAVRSTASRVRRSGRTPHHGPVRADAGAPAARRTGDRADRLGRTAARDRMPGGSGRSRPGWWSPTRADHAWHRRRAQRRTDARTGLQRVRPGSHRPMGYGGSRGGCCGCGEAAGRTGGDRHRRSDEPTGRTGACGSPVWPSPVRCRCSRW